MRTGLTWKDAPWPQGAVVIFDLPHPGEGSTFDIGALSASACEQGADELERAATWLRWAARTKSEQR